LILPGGGGSQTSFPGVWDLGRHPMFREPRAGAEWNL
jgi:hypothetical protein